MNGAVALSQAPLYSDGFGEKYSPYHEGLRSRGLSPCTELCQHHHRLLSERVRHPAENPCTRELSLLTAPGPAGQVLGCVICSAITAILYGGYREPISLTGSQ